MNNDLSLRPRVRLHGLLGRALERSAAARLKTVDYHQMTEVFRLRNEDDNGWRCEFWGKVVRSAILTNDSLHDPVLADMIETTVREILAAQTPDGCISTYPEDKQLHGWDVWGRKYVLLGLLRFYDLVRPDEAVRQGCVRLLDNLMSRIGPEPGKLSILDCGEHGGLAPASILGAVVGVYRITGEKRFLDFAHYIVDTGCSKKHNIFEAARAGTVPCELGNGKAYEMTSCFQGLAELYAFDPREEYREACVRYFRSVRDHEIFVTGAGGAKDRVGEFWDEGNLRQTERGYTGGLGETCVAATWLHYCERIAELAPGSSLPADESERTLYNAVLGAMAPDGTRWAHLNPTPLIGGGSKLPAPDQMLKCKGKPFGGHDCCRAQGPEALALALRLALTRDGNTVTLNLPEAMTAELPGLAKIEVSGNYPLGEEASIRIVSEAPFEFRLRIPAFVRSVTLNGEPLSVQPGSLLVLNRKWSESDALKMNFDLTVRETRSADGQFRAFLRGPLVLALDSRSDVPHALCHEECGGLRLVDYITAGDEMSEANTLQVWFPG